MKFTHLTNEAYPGLPDYNAGYQNEFDYSRYSAEVTVTLYRLNLDSNYNNVAAFDSADERDEWFDSVSSSLKLSLTLEKRLLPEDSLKIPIPFDVACLYNYVRITYQPVTATSEMVEYESSSGFSDYYYFITDYICRAVNTTELSLKRDEWMTFEPYCTFIYAQLNRGHYPLSKTSVSTYLASPIDNNEYLLTPDVNFGAKSIVSHTSNVVLNDSESYICFVTTSNPSSESWGDLDEYDAQVAINASYATQGFPTQMVFAIDAENHSDFLVNVDAYYPWFKQTVLCVFLAPSDLVYISGTFTFADITCYRLTAFYEYDETLLELAQSQFGFDDDYADLAKLYTYPYSYIEIIDGNGTTHEVHIEDTCGTLDVRAYLAYAYPMIGVTAHVNGLGSSSTKTISCKALSSKSMTTQGAWYDLLFSWNVPLFSIRQSEAKYNEYSQYYNRLQAETAYTNAYTAASNSATNAKTNAETSADASYTQAINSATTAQTNAQTSADASYTQTIASATTAQTNAQTSADAAYTQAYNSATAAQTNAQTSADAAYTNAIGSAATAQGNANRSAEIAVTNTENSADCATVNNALAVASNETCQSTSNTASSNLTAQGVSLALKNLYNDIDLQEAMLEADSEYTAATTAVNSISNVVSSVTSGAMSSGLAGVASGLISGAISGVTNAANAVLAIDCSSDKASATIDNMTDKAADANTYNLATVGYSNSAQTSNTDTMNTCTASQTLNNNSTMITNAENLCGVAEDNALDTYNNAVSNATVSQTATYTVAANTCDTAITNASLAKSTAYTVAANTYDTAASNALSSQTTAYTIAANNYDTASANATLAKTTAYTIADNNYDTAMANAALSMATAESAVTNSLRTAKIGNPHLFGANSGSAQDTKPWLISANVVTQSKSAIKQAGDTFLRYGYFYNGYVPLDDFNVMEHFTYWQCQDVNFYSTNGVPQTALNAIREILVAGVTVWSDPDEIGKVTIYGNE